MNKNTLYIIVEAVGVLVLLGATLFVFTTWQQIPDQIPLHFNLNGDVTNYGGKGSIIFLVAVAWVVYISLVVCIRFPKKWNLPVEITKENCQRIYGIARGMLSIFSLIVALLMTVIIITAATGAQFPTVLMPLIVGAMTIDLVGGLYLMRKNK